MATGGSAPNALFDNNTAAPEITATASPTICFCCDAVGVFLMMFFPLFRMIKMLPIVSELLPSPNISVSPKKALKNACSLEINSNRQYQTVF